MAGHILKKVCMITFVGSIFLSAYPDYASGLDKAVKARLDNIRTEMITRGNYDDALDALSVIGEHYPQDGDITVTIAMAHYGKMEYEEAFHMLNNARNKQLDPVSRNMIDYVTENMEKHKNVLSGMGEETTFEEKADFHTRILVELTKDRIFYPIMVSAHLNWIKENVPDMPAIHRVSGDINYSAMLYKAAIEDYGTALKNNDTDPSLYTLLADCYAAMGDFDNAGENYDKAISIYKEKGIRHNRKVVSELQRRKRALPKRYDDIWELVSNNRYDEAEVICRKRMSLNPLDYAAATQLGDIYWRRGERKTAFKIFKRVRKMAPEYPVIYFFLAKYYLFTNDVDKASENFREFTSKMDNLPKLDEDTVEFYVGALNTIAYYYSTQKRYDLMMEQYEKSLKLDPDSQGTHFNMAVCYYHHYRRPSMAFSHLKKVMDIDKDSKLAYRAEFFIDYMRRNPDARYIPDFSFIFEY